MTGLVLEKKDKRDFKHHRTFGAAMDLSVIPLNFDVRKTKRVMNQYGTSMCGSFASVSVSEDQEGVPLDVGSHFYFAKKIMGGDPRAFGLTPSAVHKAHTKYGCLEKKDVNIDSEVLIEQNGVFAQYQFTSDGNWREDIKDKSAKHKKQSYTECTGYGNYFDSTRAILYESKLEAERTGDDSKRKTADAGLYWQTEWTNAAGGVIPKNAGFSKDSPHYIKLCGSKDILGEPYLIIQNSYGTGVGNGGDYYISKETFLKYLCPSAEPSVYVDEDPNKLKNDWEIYQKIINLMSEVVKLMQKMLGWGK